MARKQQPSRTYPGAQLGLPRSGPGSVPTLTTRLGALIVDWALSSVVTWVLVGARAFRGGDPTTFVVLGVFWLLTTTAIAWTGASIGQWATRLTVVRLDQQSVGLWRAAVRQLLLCLVVPGLAMDRDRRGLNELVTNTVVVRRETTSKRNAAK